MSANTVVLSLHKGYTTVHGSRVGTRKKAFLAGFLLEHPFVNGSSEDALTRASSLNEPEAQVVYSTARGFDIFCRREENCCQCPASESVTNKEDDKYPPVNKPSSHLESHKTENISKVHEICPVVGTNCQQGESSCEPAVVFPPEYRVLDMLEKNSKTVRGAKSIGEDNEAIFAVLLPMKIKLEGCPTSLRDLHIDCVSQSLRILNNLIAAGVHQSCAALDSMISVLLEFTDFIVKLKLSDAHGLVIKSLSILKKLLDNSGSGVRSSYATHWIALKEIYSQILVLINDISGRILYESTACIGVMLTRVALGLKTSMPVDVPEKVSSSVEVLFQIIDHARTSGLVEALCECLVVAGSSLISGSSNMVPAACEACKAIWFLIDALETISLKQETYLFPLNDAPYDALSQTNMNVKQQNVIYSEANSIVEMVRKSVLQSKSMQVAFYYCFHNGLESALHAGLQLMSRLSMSCMDICNVLCGLQNLTDHDKIDGGGEGTILSDIFSLLSLCIPYINNEAGQIQNKRSKLSNPHGLVLHACLALSTIADCLKSESNYSASYMLTSSQKRQQIRLSVLAHLAFSDDKLATPIQLHCASAMLAFSSIASLDCIGPTKSSIGEIALSLLPPMATLRSYAKIMLTDENELESNIRSSLFLCYGLKDGYLGLIEARLKWGGPLAIEQACSNGIPQLLIHLLVDGLKNVPFEASSAIKFQEVLSPEGVVWTLSSLCHCLPGGVFRETLFRRELVKHIVVLISDAHVKWLISWGGLGGGKGGVRDLLHAVVDLFAFPFVAVQSSPSMPLASASINSGFLLNVNSPGRRMGIENREMVKVIESNMPHYIQILLEAGFPQSILRCLDVLNSKDLAKPIAIIAKMVAYRPLALQLVREGLLSPILARRLLGGSSPKEVVLDFLMIVSDLARMSKDFYASIDKAGLLGQFGEFLCSEDADFRAKSCSAIGNMCRHSDYFYESLATHGIVDLLIDRCADPDKRTRKFACFAVGNSAYHSDALYVQLRRCIPQLTKLLLSAEEEKTKGNAAGALSNLVRNSNFLCKDIENEGAIQALLKLVGDYSVVALSPSRKDAINELPLKIVLFALGKMCEHSSCRRVLRTVDSFPLFTQLKHSPDPTIVEYASIILTKAAQA
ncbi:hypothetical protein HPP92_008318 [Vanilla planifolia]|uniref:non-specific serine/threonine protein kinase n=1 Tax=Vanilla planifolia TaxID=51239 RepID=A0A835V1V3_VANPL|nr:hypothetical protein HPP92_008318 [Vanilla planifolia]